MDLRQIEYFLAVARSGTFTAAAESLHMTQPPLSLAVSKLERQLGVRLLTRTVKGVELTAAGQYLCQAGEGIVAECERVAENLTRMGQGLEGELRLAAGATVIWDYLPPLLMDLTQAAPGVDVILSDPPPGETLREVISSTVDVGIVACADPEELGRTYADDVHVLGVGELPLVIGIPPALDAQLPDPVTLADLADATWLLPRRIDRYPGLPELTESAWREGSLTPRRVRHVATPFTAVPLVAAGLGITVLPKSLHGGVHRVPTREIVGGIPPLVVTVVWNRRTFATPVTERFLRLARSRSEQGDG